MQFGGDGDGGDDDDDDGDNTSWWMRSDYGGGCEFCGFLLSSSPRKVWVPSHFILGLTSRSQRHLVRLVGTAGRSYHWSLSFLRRDFHILFPS